jgi:hypothetical protein
MALFGLALSSGFLAHSDRHQNGETVAKRIALSQAADRWRLEHYVEH